MKKLRVWFSALILLLVPFWSWACPVCERRQPRWLRGIIHGAGPEHETDYIIIAVLALCVLATGYFSVKFLVRPGENSDEHIKRTVLDEAYDD